VWRKVDFLPHPMLYSTKPIKSLKKQKNKGVAQGLLCATPFSIFLSINSNFISFQSLVEWGLEAYCLIFVPEQYFFIFKQNDHKKTSSYS